MESHLNTIPSYCAHEHWGSLAAFGTFPGGFRADIEPGALPTRRVGLLDILLDPYLGGNLGAAGINLNDLAQAVHLKDIYQYEPGDLVRIWPFLRCALADHLLSGTLQSIRLGILALYQIDILEADTNALMRLDEIIAGNYTNPFAWYQKAMGQLYFNALIRPVHPEFYLPQESSPPAAEAAFTGTMMRIDPLLDMHRPGSPRRERLVESLGIEPVDAASWRAFLTALFDLAAARGAAGIKQLQAYSRSLEFSPVDDSQVRFRGELDAAQVRCFQDWVVHACCAQAHERGWPQQVHVGTHNITQSSPMPLAELARRYPHMAIVQLHCWPFLSEAGWLAKHISTVYIDTCWLPILNPAYYSQAIENWLQYVPLHKICCSHDATSIEMAAGSAVIIRTTLARLLASMLFHQPEALLEAYANALLHGNAQTLYPHVPSRRLPL